MPLTPTYPGVYIEEVPSTVRTVTGVATSITAFVGRARRGPIDQPRRITSWGDFERVYGGLWTKSTMSYAVQQYFLNGGTDAVIARVVHTPGADEAAAAAASLGSATGTEGWNFEAVTAGAAGDAITIVITHPDSDPSRFDLAVGGNPPVSLDLAALAPGQVIAGLVRIDGPIPGIRPDATSTTLSGGADAAAATASLAAGGGAVVLAAATVGAAGNNLRASVSDPSGGGSYDLLVELLDDDGDVLASNRFVDVATGAAWPAPSDRVGTTASLLDTSSAAPAERPDNVARAAFVGGRDHDKATLRVGVTITGLPLVAANPGAWGNKLRAAFDHATEPADAEHFNIFLVELDDAGQERQREVFRNVSIDEDSPRYVEKVIAESSKLVALTGAGWAQPPATPVVAGRFDWLEFSGGDDGEAIDNGDFGGSEDSKTGLYLLETADLFNLMVIAPPSRDVDVSPAVWAEAMAYCKRRRALLLVDPPRAWASKDDVLDNLDGLGLQGANATNAALYWPYIKVADPLREQRLERFPPAGAVAGLIARTDVQHGVWSAPAGVEASLTGARALTVSVTDREQGLLNPLGVNVLRTFPVVGSVVWGARTLRGADMLASEWKYLPVRRLGLMIEESLYRGTQWAVFQGNDESLWVELRMNVTSFMHDLFRQGAFAGGTPREAYLVKCDGETTTQSDIDRGIVNVLVGFRPLKPAEFVFLTISQLAGQTGS